MDHHPDEFKHLNTISQAHPETMDFLSSAWCNFAVHQAFHPESDHHHHHQLQLQKDQSLIHLHHNSSLKTLDPVSSSPFMKIDNDLKMDDTDNFVPPWKSNDLKSWIWMQQAMHPELNYNSYLKKKWAPWKIGQPLKKVPIKKWITEMKQKSKEDKRLQRAEVHAAVSVAGLAAALAAIAAENSSSKKHDDDDDESTKATRDSAVASAAALVAAQCAKVAEAMGAKKEQLRSVMGNAMSGTSASDIITLTAAATTSLRGAATLKVRAGYKNKLINGGAPVLPIELDNTDSNFDFENYRAVMAKGAQLYLEMQDGKRIFRSVSVILNREAKVIVRIRKLNLLNAFSRPQESIVQDLYGELYKESESGGSQATTCYLLVLKTNKGMLKLDMIDDHQRYRTWSMTINHMLTLSSVTKYELQFYKV
ncbi:OLC1v1035330C1 [Oldenlandia corymbosa var. corymbosa]|uniref:OLC1v1035330C1 n=1 Tax=Oldenlandia corymbosa var. corymbosa TaxID=529605 RepID=A0AAV1CTY4_OLDCO|nr:OLC1v1035330C1 [Oldenlandia corymbosa var. corymbosa]